MVLHITFTHLHVSFIFSSACMSVVSMFAALFTSCCCFKATYFLLLCFIVHLFNVPLRSLLVKYFINRIVVILMQDLGRLKHIV